MNKICGLWMIRAISVSDGSPFLMTWRNGETKISPVLSLLKIRVIDTRSGGSPFLDHMGQQGDKNLPCFKSFKDKTNKAYS
jgi:hypothetical protein